MEPDRRSSPFRARFTLPALILAVVLGPARSAGVEPLTGAFDPSDLLETLARSVQDKDVPTYAGCLADSFVFVPYHGEVSAHPSIDWPRWGRDRETAFVEEWLGPRGGAALQFEPVLARSRTGPDREEWDLVCRMTVLGQDFRSRATLVMVRVDQRWYLEEWIDTSLETDEDGILRPTGGSARALVTH